MRVSARGLRAIARFEGFVDHAYKPVPSERFWTIGYGHYGPDVKRGQKITKTQALALLRKDVRHFEEGVERLVTTRINQNRFDALVSLAYNIGLGNFATSTVLRETNRRHFVKAAAAFRMWVKGGNPPRVLAGLVTRRAREARRFLMPVVRR
jgi:lysozyme